MGEGALAAFWSGFEALIDDLAPVNRELLQTRDALQQQIDDRAALKGLTEEEAKADLLAEKQPSKQFATTGQVGGIAVFLCSPAADQVTGQEIGVDGGWTAQ